MPSPELLRAARRAVGPAPRRPRAGLGPAGHDAAGRRPRPRRGARRRSRRLAHDAPRRARARRAARRRERRRPALVRAVRRDHDVARRVPGELAAEMARAGSQGFEVWLQAREANDYAVFEPALRRNIELARRYAACFPEAEHPYDALLDRYEPGTTTAQRAHALRAAARRPRAAARRDRPAARAAGARRRLPGRRAARGRPGDRRTRWASTRAPGAWTTPCTRSPPRRPAATCASRRASTSDSLTGLFALMHEVGHGLYEHGIDPALARTTLDTGVSLGVHESQSRLWENLVGRSEPFWSTGCRACARRCPQTLARRRARRRSCARSTSCAPTLIRVEADELTYSLHVILRFELELALIEGTLDAADLPAAWADEDARDARHRRCPTTCAASCRTSTGRRGSSATSRRTRSATSSPRSCGASRAPTCRASTTTCARGELRRAARLARREGSTATAGG